ncbi:MAG: SGNH/GDSL hydrolase family protein [Deltaproteobacteria bacterium]|nr:SGNH/GDSL hydrolase family protein [Deltaproteobacteria bacterium]MCB9479076.1 SGNH/GDSL hydrolase family protein [Deltaproteobacteria bacterium]MCB9488138.1 SGNH/GDSL hydrolase family protein [Deltaproteobacteria bacterium]
MTSDNPNNPDAPPCDDFDGFWTAPALAKARTALFVVVLLIACEAVTRVYFARPDLASRSAATDNYATSYLLDQFRASKGDGPRVAFIGSSTMQGYINTTAERAFPTRVEALLRERYDLPNVRAFNLATAGNLYADYHALIAEVSRYDPALIVVPIQIRLLSREENGRMTHPEYSAFWAGLKDAPTLKRWAGISPGASVEYRLEHAATRVSKLYAYRGLVPRSASHSDDGPMERWGTWFASTFGYLTERRLMELRRTPAHYDAPYLWTVAPRSLIKRHSRALRRLDFTDKNSQWRFLTRVPIDFPDTPILFYISPLNRPMIDDERLFVWTSTMKELRGRLREILTKNGADLIDASEWIDQKHFSDVDHFNMTGHEAFAEKLAPLVAERLSDGEAAR